MKSLEEMLAMLEDFHAKHTNEYIDELFSEVDQCEYDSPTLAEYLQSYNESYDFLSDPIEYSSADLVGELSSLKVFKTELIGIGTFKEEDIFCPAA